MVRQLIAPLLVMLLLAACSDNQSNAGPGGLTADDAKALDEAAAKLDQEAFETAEQPTE